jgi:hypothetical protein
MHKCNTAARLRNHCCRGKAIRFSYSECVSVDLDIPHVKRMRRINIVVWPVCLSHSFPHYRIKARFYVKQVLKLKCVI